MSGNLGTKIDHLKEIANPVKYFNLLEKHMPTYENGGKCKKIALVDLSSLEVELRCIWKYPNAEFHIFDNDFNYTLVRDASKTHTPTAIVVGYDKTNDDNMYNIVGDMKFDLVVGNPPYDRSLHLKILKKTIEHVDFENGGEIIWLHPARWMASIDDKKKYAWLNGFVKSFDVVNLNNYFGIGLFSYGIVTCLAKDGYDINEFNPLTFRGPFKAGDQKMHVINDPNLALKTFNKIINSKKFVSIEGFEKELDFLQKDGKYYVQHNLLVGNGGFQPKHTYFNGVSLMNGKTIFENRGAANKTIRTLINGIAFNTKDEAENYRKTYFGNFLVFLDAISRVDVHVHSEFIPFMSDYTQPWTDERFYKFFDLTSDEIKIVEDVAKPIIVH